MSRSCEQWEAMFQLALDDGLPHDEQEALAAHVEACDGCRAATAGVVRLHRGLLEAGVDDAIAVQRSRGHAPRMARRTRRVRMVGIALAAAAGLLMAVGAIWLLRERPADYALTADGASIARGATVAAHEEPVRIELGGYCVLELASGSELHLRGDARAERVELERGRVSCRVDRSVGTFAVDTAAGSASVEGTRFDAAFLPARRPGEGRRFVVEVSGGSVLLSSPSGIRRLLSSGETGTVFESVPIDQPDGGDADLLRELGSYRHRIVCETNRDGNWELYLMNADGSEPVNLTGTADVDELYPKVSPDGRRICFLVDETTGGRRTRNLYLMDIDGAGRRKIADRAREPCWGADGRYIAYLGAAGEEFSDLDYETSGIYIHDTVSGGRRRHPNAELRHLYCLNWSADGNWFVATVHRALGYGHSTLAIEAGGGGVYDLGLQCCRPDLDATGTRIAINGHDDSVVVADLDFSGARPNVSGTRTVLTCEEPLEIFHPDWSPDGRYIAFSRGPRARSTVELPGRDAPGWRICVADPSREGRWVAVTPGDASYKEPDWVPVRE